MSIKVPTYEELDRSVRGSCLRAHRNSTAVVYGSRNVCYAAAGRFRDAGWTSWAYSEDGD